MKTHILSTKETSVKKISLILFLVITATFQAMGQWVQTGGPAGGYTNEIVKVGSVLALSVGNGGIYRSTNNGESWVRSSSGLPGKEGVQALIAHNGNLYASISRSGLYLSEDEGETWQPINSGIESLTFYSFIVDGTSIYAGSANGGVYYSSDNGVSWAEKSEGIAGIQVQDFAVFNSEIYAGGTSLFKFSDEGESWEKIEITGLGVNGVRSMIATESSFYVADDGHVFVSTDNLSSWNKSNLNTSATIVNMGSVGDSVYLTTSAGRLFYTKDEGVNWTLIQNSLTNDFARDVMLLDGKIIMSTSEGLYESFDGGNSWALNNTGISALKIESLHRKGIYIFAGTDRQGIFRSEDEGESWVNVSTGLDALNALHVSDIIAIEDELFIGTGGGVYSSLDNGDNWVMKLDPGLNKSIQVLDFQNGVFAAGVNGTGVYISLDTAENWSLAATDGLNVQTSYESLMVYGDTIAVSTHNGEMFVSKDLGETWIDISIGGDYYFTYNIQYVDGKLYAATNKGLLVSQDLGANWVRLNNESKPVHDMIIQPNKIIAATNQGIYVTSASRDIWYDVSEGMGNQYVNTILLNEDTLFAGTFASSVWKRALLEANLPPVILGLSEEKSTPEETQLALTLEDLQIDDPDNTMPDDFVLRINEGANYSVVDNLIIPIRDFNGKLAIPVVVNDGISDSQIVEINIEVTAVNDSPVIKSVVKEFITTTGVPLAISLNDLVVEDPDNTFPTDFTLLINGGNNYSVSDNVITPEEGFTGDLTVPLLVNDGTDDSQLYEIIVKVTEVTGIWKEGEFGTVTIYPNPSSEKISIEFPQGITESCVIQLHNLKGELVFKRSFEKVEANTAYLLELGHFPSGLYLMSIEKSSGVKHFQKIVIKK